MKKKNANFIIYGMGRSGSNLLRTLLNSHPDVFCDNEIFHKRRMAEKNRIAQRLIKRYPILYAYYKKYLSKANIYGFKLHQNQLDDTEKVITWLQNKGWRIIHLHRKNTLKQVISLMIAQQTGSWIKNKKMGYSDEKYYLDPEELLAHIKKRIPFSEQEFSLMEKLEHLDVVYEYDLYHQDKWQATTGKIFDYINIYPVEVRTKRLKTDPRPDWERVENFEEILDFLSKKGWAQLVSQYNELKQYY